MFQRKMYNTFKLFLDRFKLHLALYPDPEFVAMLDAYPFLCYASLISVFCGQVPSQAPVQRLLLYDNRVDLAQRRILLTRAALYKLLALRLMHVRRAYDNRHLLHHVLCIMSQRNLLGSKGLDKRMFQEVQRLCKLQRFSEGTKCLVKAVLLQYPTACALLASMLNEGRPNVNRDPELAFDLASVGEKFGC